MPKKRTVARKGEQWTTTRKGKKSRIVKVRNNWKVRAKEAERQVSQLESQLSVTADVRAFAGMLLELQRDSIEEIVEEKLNDAHLQW